jgi:hypothetical protein
LIGDVGPGTPADGDVMTGGIQCDDVDHSAGTRRRIAQGDRVGQENDAVTVEPDDSVPAVGASLENLRLQFLLRANIDRRLS